MDGSSRARIAEISDQTAHPDLASEQAYIDRAYDRLEEIRTEATARANLHARRRDSSFQGTYERDVAVRVALERARSLNIGDESLCFGRIDADGDQRFYIGRRAVFDANHEPIIIDWRVPAAEPFYRATGKHPMGLVLRRHFLCEGRKLLAIEDERMGSEGGALDLGLAGTGALLGALERPRTGHMRDIVATVQAEQDEIIRSDLAGVLVVQGGPGTGKTAVALHRAAFLLFTHRATLTRQGVLVVCPNSYFLRYVDQVLPALGESGAELSTLAGLVPGVVAHGSDRPEVARLKGDVRMAAVIANAVADRQHLLTRDASIDIDEFTVSLRARPTNRVIELGRKDRHPHNARHVMLRAILVSRLYEAYGRAVRKKYGSRASLLKMSRREATKILRAHPGVAGILRRVWPLLTPAQLVGDLLASRARLEPAARDILAPDEIDLLVREDANAWTLEDLPLLDEAFVHLGAATLQRRREDDDFDEVPTYGHVVVDETQDLSPMALRMIARRSRNGSMTVVGDLAQAVGASAPASWEPIVAHLSPAGARVRELNTNYRTPGTIMDVAARVLRAAAPELVPPRSVRAGGDDLVTLEGDVEALVARLADEHRAHERGTMVVIAAHSQLSEMTAAARAGDAIAEAVSVLAVEDAKGLEFDTVVVVEPARLVRESMQGLRALYVALTRATQRAYVVHAEPLPEVLGDAELSDGAPPRR